MEIYVSLSQDSAMATTSKPVTVLPASLDLNWLVENASTETVKLMDKMKSVQPAQLVAESMLTVSAKHLTPTVSHSPTEDVMFVPKDFTPAPEVHASDSPPTVSLAMSSLKDHVLNAATDLLSNQTVLAVK